MSDPQSKPLRVALYARVSTEEQREGHTIQSQIAELEKFAASSDWIVSNIYQDDGWSGSILARPELDHLRDDAAKGLFAAVVLNDVDRLARDVTHLGIIKRDLERHGVQVIFRKLPNENSPTHNLMVNILGSFAEFEREMIADRTRRGRRHKVEVRKQYLGSRPPYGFRYIPINKQTDENGYLEVNPEEAVVVQHMYEWVDAKGLSARGLVNHLNELGLKGRKGGPWQKSSVLRILRSETYAGVWHFYKHLSCEPRVATNKYRKSLKSSRRRRPRAEWLPISLPDHLRVINRDLWVRVQARLDQNTAFSPRNSKHNYLLKGLVQCGACSGRYVGDPSKGTYYYRCIRRCKRLPTIREKTLNQIVWESVSQAILNPDRIADHVQHLKNNEAQRTSLAQAEQLDIMAALTQLQNEESRILEAYRLEVISATQLGDELERLKPRKLLLAEHQSKSSGTRTRLPLPTIKRSIREYCELVGSRLQSFTFEERQAFLRTLVRTITFNYTSIHIRGVIPINSPSEMSSSPDGNAPAIETPTTERYDRNSGEIETPTSRRCGRNPDETVEFDLRADIPRTPEWRTNKPRTAEGRFAVQNAA